MLLLTNDIKRIFEKDKEMNVHVELSEYGCTVSVFYDPEETDDRSTYYTVTMDLVENQVIVDLSNFKMEDDRIILWENEINAIHEISSTLICWKKQITETCSGLDWGFRRKVEEE